MDEDVDSPATPNDIPGTAPNTTHALRQDAHLNNQVARLSGSNLIA
jgi:hypothetical protein